MIVLWPYTGMMVHNEQKQPLKAKIESKIGPGPAWNMVQRSWAWSGRGDGGESKGIASFIIL